MQTIAKIKLLAFGCFICMSIEAICQEKVTVKVETCEFRLESGDFFEIPIVITNYEDSSILVPKAPRIFNKLGMAQGEIGIEFFYENTGKKLEFNISNHYLVEPSMISVKSQETKVIKARMPAGFFDKVVVFDAILYLLLPSIKQKDKLIYCSSNKFKIRVV